ncbi:hypothetical protein HJA87_10395 [Rhizobium bangladeshense]|uniref:Uncharacterized protein n=1 Tax=Rhizobium bangladeshense TaxID=1138189 RepID=A0ABS7LH15_9HYPH|nr:hypothetical protein [Rhizobium bangladeshense]MBX4868174.1 hypothetical protein [Rhizobium bangladeshense]MBX4875715.1 hypothetical protein [Rhizobium bangladeshense]MBX4886683.1 hypothetical protein [Rhizobium bangladeshense]MBY3590291.1 hypothetical protein [Rhizobium bangladeshense]
MATIVEINTAKGQAYAHYVHQHKQYGALLRVFGKHFDARPDTFTELVRNRPVFMCFFPLGAAVNRRIVSIVDNVALPSDAKKFPMFRAGVVDPATRKVSVWWLWDGEKEWRIGQLTAEQRQLSIRGVWNDALLVKRIECGWTPETDPT